MDVAGACGLAESMARELRRSLRGKARQAVALALRGRGRARCVAVGVGAIYLAERVGIVFARRAGTKNRRLGARRFRILNVVPFALQGFDCFVARRVNRENAREAGDFENLLYVLAKPRKRDFARNLLELLRRREQDAQARAADIFKLAAFDENFCLIFFEKLCKDLFQL